MLTLGLALMFVWCIFGACHACYRFDMHIEIPNRRKHLTVLLVEGPLVWVAVPVLNVIACGLDFVIVKICPLFKKFEDWYQEK